MTGLTRGNAHIHIRS